METTILTKEYIESLYKQDFEKQRMAEQTKFNLSTLGLLTSEMQTRLDEIGSNYENKMQDIAKRCTDQFTPRLREILGKEMKSVYCFPSLKGNNIRVRVGGGWVSISLAMDITTSKLSFENSISFDVSIERTHLEPYKQEIISELKSIM